MGWMPVAQARLTIHRLNTHASHKRGHMSSSNGVALLLQEIAQHADAVSDTDVSAVGLVPPNTSAARASNCYFHSVIWVG